VFAGLNLLALWLDAPSRSAYPAGGSTHLALDITVNSQCARRRDAPPRLGAASRITAPSAVWAAFGGATRAPTGGRDGTVSNRSVPPPRSRNPRERPAHPKDGKEA
jgi:hypothetical protein